MRKMSDESYLVEDNLQIKTDRQYWIYIALSIFGLSITPILCFTQAMYLEGSILLLLTIIFITRWCIAVFRTIILSSTGITVKFLWIRGDIPWDEVRVSFESYKNSVLHSRYTLYGAAVFYRRSVYFRKPKSWQPLNYNIFVHPFSFVYVYFPEQKNYEGPDPFPLNKQVLEEKLAAWKIKYDNNLSK